MAKKGAFTKGFKDVVFINHDLDTTSKKAFKEWLLIEAEHFSQWCDKVLDDGYNFSVKYDSYGSCFACFAQPWDEESDNAGWILTGRGSTASSAIMSVFYRHYVVFDGVWPKVPKGGYTPDDL